MESTMYHKMAEYLCRENNLPMEKAAVLAYAMETLFINLLNLLLTISIGFFLGVLPGTLVCLLVAVGYRHTAGGAHSSSPWVCAIATMIIFPALAYLGTFIAGGPVVYSQIMALAAALIGVCAVYLYAPVDSAQAPILSPDRRKKLKGYSYVVILTAITGMLLLEAVSTQWMCARIIQLCIALTVLWVSFNLTDLAKLLWHMLDNQHNSISRR